MAIGVRILSNNMSGLTTNVTYLPESGGTIDLGTQVFPFDYLSDYYWGTYNCYVPTYATMYPVVVPGPTPTPTVTSTNTSTPTPTNTETPTSTPTPTNTETSTVTPTPTNTETPTSTPTPTNTETSTVTPTPTNTETPTSTSTSTNTPTPTNTETPTVTPTNTETPTPDTSETPTPTQTSTQTPTNTQTSTQTPTNTETGTPTQTSTPTVTPTNTNTPTPTNTVTPTVTPTNTSTPTNTPTVTPTPNIVTSGLIMQLDANKTDSYPGSGTTIFDLTGSFNNTLSGGASFTNLNGINCFDCSTGTESIQVSGTGPSLPTTGYTYVTWARIIPSSVGWRSLLRTNNNLPILVQVGTDDLGYYNTVFRDSGYNVTSVEEVWVQYAVVGDNTSSIFYINGVEVGSVAFGAGGDTHVMWGNNLLAGQPFGYLANLYFYNRKLSFSEINQMYDFLSPNFVESTPTPTTTSTPTVTPTNTPTNTTTTTPTPTSESTGDFTVIVSQVGPDVVWSGSGSFDLSALSLASSGTLQSGFQALAAIWAIGPSASIQRYGGASLTGYSTTFGNNLIVPTPISSGSTFGVLSGGVSGRLIIVPSGYTSNTVISGTAIYTGATIASMGLTPGTYTWAWGSGANSSSIVMTIEGLSVSPTPTATNTATPTVTPTNTSTPTVTPTNTTTPTNTNTPTATSPIVGSGLVLYYDPSNSQSYPGSGTTLFDLTSNALNGTMSNLTFTSPYLTYNGSTSQVLRSDALALEPGAGDFSVEVWVKYDVVTGQTRTFLSKTDNGGGAADWGYGFRTSTISRLYFEVGNGTTSTTSPQFTVSTNTWYQVVGVWTNVATNSIALYINGVSQGSNTHSFTTVKNTSRPLYLGNYNGNEFPQQFDGDMGVVRYYNKALSESEILQNFNADKSKYGL